MRLNGTDKAKIKNTRKGTTRRAKHFKNCSGPHGAEYPTQTFKSVVIFDEAFTFV